ncbi:MAG: LptF/LptG family permease [Bacteroidales bacterium]|nr:LptF/LptG family permease [Bacteroidales bacterium]
MKKIDRLILKSFLGPLLLTFAIAVFVLLMQFVWKYIDDLVGKGLEFSVIAELLLYASATFVPMALPIAVLFASIMTMGNFGEKYELVAMKAGGISVSRIMLPMAIVAVMLMGIAFYFANNVLPVAMFNYRTTLYDIQRKKPAVSIRPSQYYDEIDGYVIRVNSKDPDGRTMRDIIIYDHTEGINRTNIIVADHGYMQSTPDDHYLLFTLYDGYSYSEPTDGENYEKRPLTSIGFDEQTLTFDISSFAFEKSDAQLFSNHYQMLNVAQLDSTVGTLEESLDKRYEEFSNIMIDKMHVYRYYKYRDDGSPNTEEDEDIGYGEYEDTTYMEKDSCSLVAEKDSTVYIDVAKLLADTVDTYRNKVLNQARAGAFNALSDVQMYRQMISSDKEYINRHYIELMRKFTLSVACLLLFLIGAPFGSIVRKGGLGMPLVASVVFFVLYYVIGMIYEKSVRESAIGPIGMWMATFIFIPIGALLTWQATTDSSLFDLSTWKKWLKIKEKAQGIAADEDNGSEMSV